MFKNLFKKEEVTVKNPIVASDLDGLDSEVFDTLRKQEFARLDENNQVYLDYTGGSLYPQSLLTKHIDSLSNGVFGNPHSVNPTSIKSTKLVEEARRKVLDYFNAKDDYACLPLMHQQR